MQKLHSTVLLLCLSACLFFQIVFISSHYTHSACLPVCVCALYMFIYITCGISLSLVFSSSIFVCSHFSRLFLLVFKFIYEFVQRQIFMFLCHYFSEYSQYQYGGKSICSDSVYINMDKNLDDEMKYLKRNLNYFWFISFFAITINIIVSILSQKTFQGFNVVCVCVLIFCTSLYCC